MSEMRVYRDGTEIPNGTVIGFRTRYSTNGGYHRIDALVYVARNASHVTKTSYQVENEVRADAWSLYVNAYVGLDAEEAAKAERHVRGLYETRATLTE